MKQTKMENAEKPSWKTFAKEKALACYEYAHEKAPVYWQVFRTKTVEMWDCGAKGKAICIGTVVGVLLLGWIVFGGKSENKKISEAIAKSQADTARTMSEAQAKSDAIHRRIGEQEAKRAVETECRLAEEKKRRENLHHKDEECVRQQAEHERQQAEDMKRAESERLQQIAKEQSNEKTDEGSGETVADLEMAARDAMSGIEIWGQIFKYAPEKKVTYTEFAEVYYTIEDAFIPTFAEPLLKLQSGQPIYFAGYAEIFAKNLIPRADHLLFYCCRTGLSADASVQEWKNYVRLLAMAQMEKVMIRSYALAFGQDSQEMLEAANEQFKEFTALRKTLPQHKPSSDAEMREKRYCALPYPARPIDLNDAAGDIFNDCQSYFTCLYNFWPGEEEASQDEKDARTKRRLAFAQRKWVPIDVGSFPIKTFCGLEFGQTLSVCEKALGKAIGPSYYLYDNHSYNFAAYHLKKPFRKFTRAFLKFGTESEEYEKTPEGRMVEGLRSVRLEADISADVNYESCLDELAKVKKLLEEKYKLNIGKGQVGERHIGKSYWYGVGLSEKGRIVLGILPTRRKYDPPKTGNVSYEDAEKAQYGVTDGSMTMVLEIQYTDGDEMKKMADNTRKAFDAKRAAEAESKKKKLNVSDNEGADVL